MRSSKRGGRFREASPASWNPASSGASQNHVVPLRLASALPREGHPRIRSICGIRSCLRSYNIVLSHTRKRAQASWRFPCRPGASQNPVLCFGSQVLGVRMAIPRIPSSCGRRSCLRSYHIVLEHAKKRKPNASKPLIIIKNCWSKSIFLSKGFVFTRKHRLTRMHSLGKPCLCGRYDQGTKQLGLGATLARREVFV